MKTDVATTTGVRTHTKITILIGMGAAFFIGISLMAQAMVVTQTPEIINPDTTPPEASIIAPANEAVLSGTAVLKVYANDNLSVTRMEVYLDNKLRLIVKSPKTVWLLPWDTTKVADGTHAWLFKLYDEAGNETILDPLVVTVTNSKV